MILQIKLKKANNIMNTYQLVCLDETIITIYEMEGEIMNTYIIVYSDGTTETVERDSIASVVFLEDNIDWECVIAVFKID